METFLVPADDEADRKMAADFRQIAAIDGEAGVLSVCGRDIKVKCIAPGVAWFHFDELCRSARSQNDYLEIAREHHTVMVSGVPKMSAGEASEAGASPG